MPLPLFRPAAQVWPPVLLGSQFVFNIGFYAVVPFLAIFLRDDMMLSGGLIGLILGLRTFSQQGMFFVGGALSDRFGARIVILAGCLIRVSGYLLLAFGQSLWPIIVGACLTGIGGALFSPSIEALLAKAGTQSEARGKRSRAEWFALFAVCGELGAVLGPVAGALMTGLGFRQVALAGAGVFVVALIVLFFALPSAPAKKQTLEMTPWWTTFRQPRFVAFIIAYSAWLLSYSTCWRQRKRFGTAVYAGLGIDYCLSTSAGTFCASYGSDQDPSLWVSVRLRLLCQRRPVRGNSPTGGVASTRAVRLFCHAANAGPDAAGARRKRSDPLVC